MIRGYFEVSGGRTRPFINATFRFPEHGRAIEVSLLVDTGADRTILSPFDGGRLAHIGIDTSALPQGAALAGVGGRTTTRVIEAVLVLAGFSRSLSLPILEPPGEGLPRIPSLLGRDVLSAFGFFIDQRTGNVLLLSEEEVDALVLPH